jgi:hypothetical protein
VIAYAPRHRPGLRIELLIEEKLILVGTASPARAVDPASYVYVDWGGEFAEQHSLAYPELEGAPLSVNFGPLGLEYLLSAGGSGYFRESVAKPHLRAGRLHRVAGAPEFLYPAYAVYPDNADSAVLPPALEGLRTVAARLRGAPRAARPRPAAASRNRR